MVWTQAISNDTLDQLIGESKTTDDIFGKGGLIRTLAKRLIERILECEMHHHLGYAKHEVTGNNSGNSRNGYSQKKVILSEEKTDIPMTTQCAGFKRWKLSLILLRKPAPIFGKVSLKKLAILSLNSLGEPKNWLFRTCSFITFHKRSIALRLGL